MRGWQFTDTGAPLVLGDIAEPSPGPDEVVLDVKAAGLCHSDVGAMENPMWLDVITARPVVFGHEIAGVVTSVGDGVNDFHVGQRVGVCPMSAHGGGPGYTRHGGFASQHLAPTIDLVAMPDGLSFELAALGTDAGMTAYHALVGRGGCESGMKVGIIGFGGLGQIAARVAVLRGAEVHVAEINEKVWPEAEKTGAASVVKSVDDWAGKGFDLVVDYAGVGSTTRSALKAIRFDGTVVLVGMAAAEFTLDTMDVIMGQARLVGSMGGTKDDIAAIYEHLASGEVEPTVTTISFDDIPQGIDDLKHHRVGGRIVARIGR